MKRSIVFVTSQPMSVVAFMLPHIRAIKRFKSVQVFANTNDTTLLQKLGVDVAIDPVRIVRPIDLWADLKALWVLYSRFKKIRPLAVHTITPKAGLLGITAAWLACVPIRAHSFTGQVWVTRTGFMRWLLKASDKCIANMATDVFIDSPSQRDFLIQQGVVSAERSTVLGAGSICGVNIKRFCPRVSVRHTVRKELGSNLDALVCLYLGRLNFDKGVLDLAVAFAQVAAKYPKVELWVVGPDEANWFEQMQALLGGAINQVKRVGFTDQPECFMQAADIFCLPSYREGFGSSVIEAAACAVPALVSRIYGLTDAVIEGETGWMYEVGNVGDLVIKLDYLLSNPAEIKEKGYAAQKRAINLFAEDKITVEMVKFYQEKLK